MAMAMRRRQRGAASETDDDDQNSRTGYDSKSLPRYVIVPSNDTHSLVSTFRKLKAPESSVSDVSPDSSQDRRRSRRRSKLVNTNPSVPPPTSSGRADVTPPLSSEEFRISDDLRLHQPNCTYARWCQTSSTLLTDEEIKVTLTANFVNKLMEKGRAPSLRKALRRANNRSNKIMADSPIRYYLDSQREMLNSGKDLARGGCTCPAARIRLQEEVITSTRGSSESPSSSVGSQQAEAAAGSQESYGSSSSRSPTANSFRNGADEHARGSSTESAESTDDE